MTSRKRIFTGRALHLRHGKHDLQDYRYRNIHARGHYTDDMGNMTLQEYSVHRNIDFPGHCTDNMGNITYRSIDFPRECTDSVQGIKDRVQLLTRHIKVFFTFQR